MQQQTTSRFISETLILASNELLSRFGSPLHKTTKADSSFVTDADLASERVILERIRQYFPDDIIMSEEAGTSSLERKPGQYIWIVDPLDGTTNFANRYHFYSISIGRGQFLADGHIEILNGGIMAPATNDIYLAEKGKGATCNGVPMQIAEERALEESFLCTGFYYDKSETLSIAIQRFENVAQRCQAVRRDGSAALDMALTANGVFDGFWEFGLQPWDLAAGSLMIREAGGIVSNYPNYQRNSYSIEGVGLVCGNQTATSEILKLL